MRVSIFHDLSSFFLVLRPVNLFLIFRADVTLGESVFLWRMRRKQYRNNYSEHDDQVKASWDAIDFQLHNMVEAQSSTKWGLVEPETIILEGIMVSG